MNIRTAVALLATLPASLLAGPAAAEPLPKAANTQAGRCVAVVRAAVSEEGTIRILHTITDIRTVGARREFIIESAVYGPTSPEGRPFRSRCLAERWGEGVELKWVRLATGQAA